MILTRRAAIVGASLLALVPLARAQRFPDRPLKIVYTYSAGGTGDSITRLIAEAMSKHLGKAVIVENKTGGSGTIGVLAVQRSPADGYTMVVTTVPTVVQLPMVTKDPSFDPVKSLTPLGVLGSTPFALLAHSSVPANDFPSFVEWARKQEKGVDVAVAGPTNEVLSALLSQGANIKLINVPFRGGAQALQATLAGDTKLFFNSPTPAMMEFLKQGRLKLLGVATAEPSPLLPGGVPIGKFVPNFAQDMSFGIWAPPGLPADIATTLKDALRNAMAEPGMAQKFSTLGVMMTASAGAEDLLRVTRQEVANIKRASELVPIKYE